MRPLVITFAATGGATARKIADLVGGEFQACGPNGEDGRALVREAFRAGRPIIGICAAGILIRLVAPLLADKREEPPVLAVSIDGAHVVPLLGGHRGANRLAQMLAGGLGGAAALTTASDARFVYGLDEPPEGWVLENPGDAKRAMAAVLGGATIALDGDMPWLGEAGYPIEADGAIRIAAGESIELAGDLVYRPKTLVAGIGCARGAPAEEVIHLIRATLADAGLSPLALAALGSVEIKADEAALHAAAAQFGVPLRLFSVAELAAERDRLPNPSAVVEAEVGTPGVAEAVALKAGSLVVPKRKSANATCAIGRAATPHTIQKFGRAPGLLHVVGIGPGDRASRTGAAVRALEESSDWVGYGLYLDLVADLWHDQAVHRFELGDEDARVRHALELAGQGRTVALICSGDAQIYAMAALVFELLEAEGERAVSAAARRAAVACHPGISALQTASARAGALIGHDFCAISLSDLLTPRETVLDRLRAAAEGDFVVALYNPRSARRTELIEEAKAIFLAHRRPETPVLIGRALGRPDERIEIVRLGEFDPSQIDMMTVVLVGSSASRAFRRGDGRLVAYTLRGYAKKALAAKAPEATAS
jgi:cobalt-precorrin 5A hydrolase / cobalt-factor III methyltransferase / precorrin-3B C17-methyltransferase